MNKNEEYILTPAMMHEAEEMLDELRAERFRHPKMCPQCGSDNLTAEVPHVDYIRYKLINGEWVDIDENEAGGDWSDAEYHCQDCRNEFKPGPATGWAIEEIMFKRRFNIDLE